MLSHTKLRNYTAALEALDQLGNLDSDSYSADGSDSKASLAICLLVAQILTHSGSTTFLYYQYPHAAATIKPTEDERALAEE